MWLLIVFTVACAGPADGPPRTGERLAEQAPEDPPEVGPAEAPPVEAPAGSTIRAAFPPPPGAERVPADAFGEGLRDLPLRAADAPVRTHDGRIVGHRARVVELPLVPGDLQQCADSALRLRAEYLRDRGEPVVFHATSGDPMPWSRYADGERAYETGGRLAWQAAAPASWEGYLAALFTWAGTRSLVAYDTVPDTVPEAGDLLVEGGSPGHAVVLLDVAVRGSETFLLVGEGFMPAQDFHVELGPEGGWWRWGPGLELSHWSFDGDALRRWR